MEEEQGRRKKQKIDKGVQIWVKYSDYEKVVQEVNPNSTIYELKHNIRNHPELLLSSFKLSQIILSTERKLEPEEKAAILNSGDTIHVEVVQNQSTTNTSITSSSATETQKNVLVAIPRVVVGDIPLSVWWNRSKISSKQGVTCSTTQVSFIVDSTDLDAVTVGQTLLTIPNSSCLTPGRYVCRYVQGLRSNLLLVATYYQHSSTNVTPIAKSNIFVKVASPEVGTDAKKSLKALCLQSIHSNIFCFKSFSKLPSELIAELMEYLDYRGALDDNTLPLFFGSNMTTLSLNYTSNVSNSLADIGQHCPNLSLVKLRDFANDAVVLAIVKGCPSLQELSLHADCVSSSTIEAIAHYCKNLRKLVLKHAANLNTDEFKALVQVCKNLEVLKITEGFIEAACNLKILIANTPNVKELSLINCQVQDSTLQTISTSCPKIVELNRKYDNCSWSKVCIDVSKSTVTDPTLLLSVERPSGSISYCKLQLKYINVQGCQLTDRGKELLTAHFAPKGTKIKHSAVKIQVDKNSAFLPNEPITGTYKYYYAHSSSDWLAIHTKGSSTYQNYTYLSSPAAKFSIASPKVPGEYELVLHTTTGITSERVPFRVEGEAAPISILLEARPTQVTSDDKLTVRITSASGINQLPDAWFGIFAVGSDVWSYLDWKYFVNPSSSVIFDMSELEESGDYEVRLVDDDDVTILAKSNTFTLV